MKKIIKIILIIIVVLFILVLVDTIQAKVFNNRPIIKITKNYNKENIIKKDMGILVDTYIFENKQKLTVFKWQKNVINYEEIDLDGNDGDKLKDVTIIINDKNYKITLEDNETTRAFIDYLPQEFRMKELNGNEKYVYMDKTFPTNDFKPKQINKGDIMLYGNNCLVIFYKTFTTTYSYTKIGHIDNMPDLDNENIIVKFEKN